MNVREDPHAFAVFWVESESETDMEHMVDLDDNKPLGGCGCAHYTCVCLPAFEKTGELKRCKHLIAVIEHVRENYLDSKIE